MEFEELQQIWDSQNDRPLYVIDQKALHNRIQTKMKRAGNITNFSELLLILVNLSAASFVLAINVFSQSLNIYMYLMVAWMFGTALYLLARRMQRIKGNTRFDRSMLGDLNYAISLATYQVRLSQLMRWNILPIGALSIFGVLSGEKPIWVAGIILIFFVVAYFASNWEHGIYESRKRELKILQDKLKNEISQGPSMS